MPTIAQEIAANFDNDGTTWLDTNGHNIAENCGMCAVDIEVEAGGNPDCNEQPNRCVFADGSAIIIFSDCWAVEKTGQPWVYDNA